jgi:hypothetical protein
MSEQSKKRPTHRISFAKIERDKHGNNKLGNAREIGAIWARDKPGEGILRFDHTPEEQGVYFVKDLSVATEDRTPPAQRDIEHER